MESNNSTPDEVETQYNTRSQTQTTDKDVRIWILLGGSMYRFKKKIFVCDVRNQKES